MDLEETPQELQRWHELNQEYDRLEAQGRQAEADALYPEIQAAWESAPLRVRASYDWRMLKQVLREAWQERLKGKGRG